METSRFVRTAPGDYRQVNSQAVAGKPAQLRQPIQNQSGGKAA